MDKTLVPIHVVQTHETNPVLLRVGGETYVLCGYELKKQKIEVLSSRLLVAICYRDKNFLVVGMASDMTRQIFNGLDQQRSEFLSLADMPWSWDLKRIEEVTRDEPVTYTSLFG